MTTFLRTATVHCFLAAACLIAVMATQVNADDQVWTTKVNGVISQMRSGLIMVTTSWGSMTIQSDALTEAKVGDGIIVWVNENNVVLNYHRAGESPYRRFVTGILRYTDRTKSHIRLWTPEGEELFSLVRIEKANNLQEGHPITLEVSEARAVLDLWQSS